MAQNSSKNRRDSNRPAPMNPRLFVSLMSIVVIVPLLVYWSFTHRGMQIFGVIALAFPVFLILAWYRARKRRL